MQARGILVLIGLLLWAGCFGSGGVVKTAEEDASASPRPSSNRTSRGGSDDPDEPGPTNETTNSTVLHLLGPPKVSRTAPTATTDIRIPMEYTFCCSARALFTYTAKREGQIKEGNATLWFRVTEITPTLGFGCDFSLQIQIQRGNSFSSHSFYCATGGFLDAITSPGLYEVHLTRSPNPYYSSKIEKGDQLRITVYSYPFSHSLRPTVELLTGSKEHDSRLAIVGWDENAPAANQTSAA